MKFSKSPAKVSVAAVSSALLMVTSHVATPSAVLRVIVKDIGKGSSPPLLIFTEAVMRTSSPASVIQYS